MAKGERALLRMSKGSGDQFAGRVSRQLREFDTARRRGDGESMALYRDLLYELR